MKRNLLLIVVALLSLGAAAQIKWYNPQNAGYSVIQNQAWAGEERENFYNRFPLKAKGSVRGTVWSLSHHSAGECISFVTNAKKIEVWYIVAGGKFMWHMPATRVAGVDLYTKFY